MTAPSGTRNRVCASNFDGHSKAVLGDAISYFRGMVATVHGFPEVTGDRDEWVTVARVESHFRREIEVDFTLEAAGLVRLQLPLRRLIAADTTCGHLSQIKAHTSQARGQLKTVARPIAESPYGLLDADLSWRDV